MHSSRGLKCKAAFRSKSTATDFAKSDCPSGKTGAYCHHPHGRLRDIIQIPSSAFSSGGITIVAPVVSPKYSGALRGNQQQTGRRAMKRIRRMFAAAAAFVSFAIASAAVADDFDQLVRVDHYVGVRSTAPATAGQITPVYGGKWCAPRSHCATVPSRIVWSFSFMAQARRRRSALTFPIGITARWAILPRRVSTCSRWIRPVTDARRVRPP